MLWSFWLKPSESIPSLPDNEQDCIFSYGNNNNHYRMFVTQDQSFFFAVKINGANIGINEPLIDYNFNTARWHHFINII